MTKKKIAIVTGGGSGIGQATALAFARSDEFEGVFIAERNPAGIEETRSLAGDAASKIEGLLVDMVEPDAPARVVSACVKWFGRIDTLVNNIGSGKSRPLHETTDADLDRLIGINLKVTFRLSREAIQVLRANAPASIVNVASALGLSGARGNAPYAASKGGVIQLTRQMAADYGQWNIRVNCVAPGITLTPFTTERMNAGLFVNDIGHTALQRIGRPEEIAAGVFFLASDAASYVTGQILAVDGGWSATHIY